MSTRELILTRIRSALAGATEVERPPRSRRPQAPPSMDVLELFADRVRDYKAIVHVLPEDRANSAVVEALEERGRILAPDDLPVEWLTQDIETVADGALADLSDADGAVTGCAVAIAETGTIVLDGGPGQGTRALSLIPDYHLCLVRADQIVPDVPHALDRLDPRQPLTWISGPSATSDIELDRVEGVHGPRNLAVIVLTPYLTDASCGYSRVS